MVIVSGTNEQLSFALKVLCPKRKEEEFPMLSISKLSYFVHIFKITLKFLLFFLVCNYHGAQNGVDCLGVSTLYLWSRSLFEKNPVLN